MSFRVEISVYLFNLSVYFLKSIFIATYSRNPHRNSLTMCYSSHSLQIAPRNSTEFSPKIFSIFIQEYLQRFFHGFLQETYKKFVQRIRQEFLKGFSQRIPSSNSRWTAKKNHTDRCSNFTSTENCGRYLKTLSMKPSSSLKIQAIKFAIMPSTLCGRSACSQLWRLPLLVFVASS